MPIEARPATKDEWPHRKGGPQRPERATIMALKPDARIRIVNHDHRANSGGCRLAVIISAVWAKELDAKLSTAHDGADLLVWRVK